MTAEQTQDPVPGPAMDRLAAARAALAAAEQSVAAGGAAPVRGPTQAEASMDAGGATSPDSPRATGGGESDPYQVARTIALRQLTVGPRTRAQLEDKLRQRGCPDGAATAVLDRLTEVGLVDDAAFARLVVRSRQETRGLAALALRHELRGKGVAEEHIDAALEDTDPATEREQARRLVAKRLRTMHGLEREVQTRRLAGFLARKGYGPGVSYEVIRDALEAAPEHQRD
jgi:regulatory protein